MSEDWEDLTEEQQQALDSFRKTICDVLIQQSEAFYAAYPELRLTWSFTIDALIREKHPVVLQPL